MADIVLGNEHDTCIEDELIRSTECTSRARTSPSMKEAEPANLDSSVVVTQVELGDDEDVDEEEDPFADAGDGSSVEEDDDGSIEWSGDEEADDCSDSSVDEEEQHGRVHTTRPQDTEEDIRHDDDSHQAHRGSCSPEPRPDARDGLFSPVEDV